MLLNNYATEELVSDRTRADNPRHPTPSPMLCVVNHTASPSRKVVSHLHTSLFLVIIIICALRLVRKIYHLLLSKHMHDIPYYKCNYRIIVDR